MTQSRENWIIFSHFSLDVIDRNFDIESQMMYRTPAIKMFDLDVDLIFWQRGKNANPQLKKMVLSQPQFKYLRMNEIVI